jgi:catechol 2,3-dioxygenase-like lactoylglutathione lyase family enzyme
VGLAIEKVLAGIAVGDFDSARDWYGRLLGRAPDAEPMGGLAEWHPSEHGGIQLVEDGGRAGSSLVTLVVDSLHERLSVLEAKGIPAGPIVGTLGVVRAVTVTDPEGNLITFAESLTDED